MQIITRNKYPSIKKAKIKDKATLYYENLDLNLIKHLIQETIEECICNTIDLITLLRENYQSNLTKTIEKITDYSQVRFNCYYASKVLKEKLEKNGYQTSYISYKSIGFSSSFGDDLIKEAHMSLLLRTIRNNTDYYLILDPGYRLPEPIGFYPQKTNNISIMDNDTIKISKINKELYPYSVKMTGYNRYSLSNNSYECIEYFNADYETLNLEDILFPLSYKVLDSYRAIRYSKDSSNRASIKIALLDRLIECSSTNKKEIIQFNEIKKISRKELINILIPYTNILKLSPKVLIEDLYFLIRNYDEFINNVIQKEVIEEKIKIKETNN